MTAVGFKNDGNGDSENRGILKRFRDRFEMYLVETGLDVTVVDGLGHSVGEIHPTDLPESTEDILRLAKRRSMMVRELGKLSTIDAD